MASQDNEINKIMAKALAAWDLIAIDYPKEYSFNELTIMISSFSDDETSIINLLAEKKFIENTPSGRWKLTNKGLAIRVKAGTSNIPKMAPVSSEHNWIDFKNLLSYYVDCVAIEGKKQYYMKPEKYGEQYYIPRYMDWGWLQTIDEKPKHHVLHFENNELRFKGALMKETQWDSNICIGYPVLATYNTTHKIEYFVPLSLIPVKRVKEKQIAESYGYNNVEVEYDFKNASINLEWIEKCIPYEYHEELMNALDTMRDDGELDLSGAIPLMLAYANIEEFNYEPNALEQHVPEYGYVKKQLCNTAILFKQTVSPYTKNLLRELNALKTVPASLLDQTSLAYIYRNPPLEIDSDTTEISIPFGLTNSEQSQAVSTALTSPVVQVQGPPGTGKSQMAVNLIANCIYRGQSVLFTSRNHAALDAIRDKSTKILGNDRQMVQFCIDEDSSKRTAWYGNNYIDYASLFKEGDVAGRATNKIKVDGHIESIKMIRNKYEKDASNKDEFFLAESAFEKEKANYQKQIAFLDEEPESFDAERLKDIADRLIETRPKKSFLSLFSKKKDNSDTKQEEALKDLEYFNSDLKELYNQDKKNFFNKVNAIHEESLRYKDLDNRLTKKLKEISQMSAEERDDLATSYKKHMDAIQKMASDSLCSVLQEGFDSITPAESDTLDITRKNINLDVKKKHLLNQNPDNITKLKTNIKIQHRAEPAWCTSLLSMPLASPLLPGIFDQLIIDEASQIDCICIIPAMYRAKRIAMIGDPEQFKPIYGIKPNKHAAIWYKHFGDSDTRNAKWNYLGPTAFEAVETKSTPKIMLKEHFRCADGIAAYFNDVFYKGQLRVRTSEHPLNFPTCFESKDSFQWIEVTNSMEGEINAAVECFVKMKESGFKGSIGIINPLREVVERIRTKIISLGYSDNDVMVNTAYGFQGGECDVIIFVIGYNDDVKNKKRWYITSMENRNIYNVTISRAKACLIAVGDREACKTASMLELRKMAYYPKEEVTNKVFGSHLEEVFYNALLKRNIVTEIQYPIIGYALDMAYCDDYIKLDIEVDGVQYHFNPDGTRKQHDIDRDIALQNIGWTIERFVSREIIKDIDSCIDRVEARIKGAKAKAFRNR